MLRTSLTIQEMQIKTAMEFLASLIIKHQRVDNTLWVNVPGQPPPQSLLLEG